MAKQKIWPVKDASIANHSRSYSYMYQNGKSSTMDIGCWDWENNQTYNYYAYQGRALLQFDLPALPEGTVITNAKLKTKVAEQESLHSWNNTQFYYDRYRAVYHSGSTYYVYEDSGTWSSWNDQTVPLFTLFSGHTSYSFSSSSGYTYHNYRSHSGGPIYSGSSTSITETDWVWEDWDTGTAGIRTRSKSASRTRYSSGGYYSQGTYIDRILAEDGTYPNNGRHSDGYWYVKREQATTGIDKQPNRSPILVIHRITNEWDEGTGDGISGNYQNTGVTWSNRKYGGYRWNANGGDFDSTPAATQQVLFSGDGLDEQVVEFDITTLVNQWKNGTHPNHGILIKYQDDTLKEGHVSMWTKEEGEQSYVPYIEIEYSTPPEKPRGLTPNNQSIVSSEISGSMKFQWNFVDTQKNIELKETIGGKTDIVFCLDTSGSFQYDYLNGVKQEIKKYINKIDQLGVDYRLGFVGHRSYGLSKIDFTDNKLDFFGTLDRLYPSGGDYWGTHRVITDTNYGAASFTYRSDADKHIVFMTDENRKGSTDYDIEQARSWASTNGMIVSVCVLSSYLYQFEGLVTGKGGASYTLGSNFGDELHVPRIIFIEEVTFEYEEDSQSNAEVRIYRVDSETSKVLIHTASPSSPWLEYLYVDSSIFEDGKTYEWEVTTFDQNGLASPIGKAEFQYKAMDQFTPPSIWSALPSVYEPIYTNQHLAEIKSHLLAEAQKYYDFDTALVHDLFKDGFIPSKKEFTKLQNILVDLYKKEGLIYDLGDLVGISFGVSDIQKIRNGIDSIANSGPGTPSSASGKLLIGTLNEPAQIEVTSYGAEDKTVDIKWLEAIEEGTGIEVSVTPPVDTDIFYYKLHHEYRNELPYGGNSIVSKTFRTEYYYTPDQINDSTVFIKKDGDSIHDYMYWIVYDKNGRKSEKTDVDLDLSGYNSSYTSVSYYEVQYQVLAADALAPNTAGTWNPVINTENLSTIHYAPDASGTLWYRVRAVDQNGVPTDWRYTTSGVLING